MFKRARVTWLLALVFALTALGVQAQVPITPPDTAIPGGPVTSVADSRLLAATGPVQVVVRLTDPPLAAVNGLNWKRVGGTMTTAQLKAYKAKLHAAQDAVAQQIASLGGIELGRVSVAHNAIMASIDAARVADLAAITGVSKVRPLVDYELALTDTVPYIGAAAVQAAGKTGKGVAIAIVDSGIDYTHKNLGGSGQVSDYQAAVADQAHAPAWTAKVVRGYDFVGDTWPNTARIEDPNPIDIYSHGTHVADIAAGASLDGTHVGVAPGAVLYAVKACSSVSSSCNGVALLLGLDYAIDPHGDGSMTDAADIVNMSLGSAYGQREDDLSEASAILVQAGIVVVAAAGNNGDRPYIVSSPSTTPEVISVAQTTMPNAKTYTLTVNSPASIAGPYTNTATVSWAPIVNGFSGDVVYVGQGCPASGSTAADPYLADPNGKIALIKRGTCSISLKVERAAQAGAIGALIGLVASGDAVTFSSGGGSQFVETLVITYPTSTAIQNALAGGATVNATVSPNVYTSIAGSMASTSARGPGYSYNSIKPEIGAPGESVSALVGTGTGTESFGGTSGATPMVSGSAALMLEAKPALTPGEVKAQLMNSAYRSVYTNQATMGSELAPITRIGAGEVRVDKAVALKTAAWDAGDPASVGLSFGTYRVNAVTTLKKKVLVRNYASTARTYSIATSYRYANDAASGAVTLSVPSSVMVKANGTATVMITMTVTPSRLSAWPFSASLNGTGSTLQGAEYDGYVTISDSTDTVTLPWQVLPHKAANVKPGASSVTLSGGSGSLLLSNVGGAVTGQVDVFALTGTSPQVVQSTLPAPGDNYAIVDLRYVGVRYNSGSGTLQFAINTFGQRSHPNYPAEFDVYVDTNGDGRPDYVIYTAENGSFGSSGVNLTYVLPYGGSTASAYYYTTADLSSSNVIMTVPASALGVTASSQITFSVYAFDNYFTGSLTDSLENMTFTLGTPKYVPANGTYGLPVGFSGPLGVQAVSGGATASPSQAGLLLMYTHAPAGKEADAIVVQ